MVTLLLCLLSISAEHPAAAADAYARERAALVAEVRDTFIATSGETGLASLSNAVAAVLAKVPRHEFVPPSRLAQAYRNYPVPIGHGQTISQPYIVALMTQVLDLQSGDTVLEIGTGSGYQAAVLAELVTHVYTIEIIAALAEEAESRLRRLGYTNITVRQGDGYHGWAAHAPFDAIVVTAAASHVPPPLVSQLRPGGKMVIPVGSRFLTQYLLLIEKTTTGVVTTREILPVRFVPLTGGH